MISQDGKQIFLTFPAYSAGYIRYLNDQEPMRPHFLTLHTYRPYEIDNHILMENVSRVIMAHIVRKNRLL